MRLAYLAFVPLALFAAGQPGPLDAQQTKTRFEGRVISTTGEPVPKATVSLDNVSIHYIDLSDRDGTFRFEDIKPGSYTLTVVRAGFLGQWNPTPYVLSAGQVVNDVVMRLPKDGVISGKGCRPRRRIPTWESRCGR